MAWWETDSWQLRWRKVRGDFYAPTFTPDGAVLAVSEANSLVQLLAPATGAVLAVLEAPGEEHVERLAFSSDGRYLAQLQRSVREVILWDLKLIRQQLAGMGLDWDQPSNPATQPAAARNL